MIMLLLIGWAGWLVTARLQIGRPMAGAAVAATTVFAPIAGLAVGSALVARHRWMRASRASAGRSADEDEVTMLADLVALSLAAGLSIHGSFAAARPYLQGGVAAAVDDLLAAMDRHGAAPALVDTDGLLGELAQVVAGAAASGAPLAGAVRAYASTRRQVAHAARLVAARRLPVRLLIPLALLILPGFVVLAVGPAVLQALARLGPIP